MAGTLAPVREDIDGDVDEDVDLGKNAGRRQADHDGEGRPDPDRPWVTIVWNDPINLMSYVTHVFITVFDFPKAKAERLMLDVHQKGRAVVSSGTRERMELDVHTLHGYGLWATLQQD